MLVSLGKVVVATAGVPERATKNQASPAARFVCHSILVEAVAGNIGKIYIGIQGLNRSTLAGVFAVLAVPTANILPTFSATITFATNGFNLADLWIDGDNNGEAALVSCIVA